MSVKIPTRFCGEYGNKALSSAVGDGVATMDGFEGGEERIATDRSVRVDGELRLLRPGFHRIGRVGGDVIVTARTCRILKDAPEGASGVFRRVRQEPLLLFALARVE